MSQRSWRSSALTSGADARTGPGRAGGTPPSRSTARGRRSSPSARALAAGTCRTRGRAPSPSSARACPRPGSLRPRRRGSAAGSARRGARGRCGRDGPGSGSRGSGGGRASGANPVHLVLEALELGVARITLEQRVPDRDRVLGPARLHQGKPLVEGRLLVGGVLLQRAVELGERVGTAAEVQQRGPHVHAHVVVVGLEGERLAVPARGFL